MVEDKKQEDQHFTQAPPKRSNWESFKIFLWNEQTGEFLGRSASNWGNNRETSSTVHIYNCSLCIRQVFTLI